MLISNKILLIWYSKDFHTHFTFIILFFNFKIRKSEIKNKFPPNISGSR